MKVTNTILAAALTLSAATAGAQTLNKEITVERDIVPEYREADRIRFTPGISLPDIVRQRLDYSLVDRPVGITPSVYTLGLPAPAMHLGETWRGYAAVGFMPIYNAAASAGYRFIDTRSTRLDGWLQYDGRAYRDSEPRPADGGKDMLRSNDITLGVDLATVSGASAFNLFADYTYSRYNMQTPPSGSLVPRLMTQGINRFNVAADWSHRNREGLSYGIDAAFSRFAFIAPRAGVTDITGATPFTFKGSRESKFNVGGFADMALGAGSSAVLDVDFSYLHGASNAVFVPSTGDAPWRVAYTDDGALNTWLLRLTPAYRFSSDAFTAKIGARIDLSHGGGKAFHIAPDVALCLRPMSYFAIELQAGGGEVQNSLASLYDVSRYMMPYFLYRNSHIPFTADAKVTVGPFSGAYLEVFGGYARANDWLMPTAARPDSYAPVDLRGWHGGVAAGYRHGKRGEIRVSAEAASHGDYTNPTSGYYLWRDRAKTVIEASGRISPIDALDITAAYSLRSGRNNALSSLGNASLLSFGAAYRITPRLTVFANGENLLNKRYTCIGGTISQGITGLAGVTYKF